MILELGGKSSAIVFEDANLKKAVAQTQFSTQVNSGQVCMANSRIYVQRSIASQFVEAFKTEFAAARAGDPLDKDTNHGPQADEVQYHNVLNCVGGGGGGREDRHSGSGWRWQAREYERLLR